MKYLLVWWKTSLNTAGLDFTGLFDANLLEKWSIKGFVNIEGSSLRAEVHDAIVRKRTWSSNRQADTLFCQDAVHTREAALAICRRAWECVHYAKNFIQCRRPILLILNSWNNVSILPKCESSRTKTKREAIANVLVLLLEWPGLWRSTAFRFSPAWDRKLF